MGLRITLGVCALALGLEGKAWAVAPNFIVIIADDFGSDKMSQFVWNGGTTATSFPQTPNLNKLGNSGLRFTNAWANPVCSPTRAALNTGMYAWRSNIGLALGDSDNTSELDEFDTFPLLAGVLADEYGYQTALFGKWHLGETGSPTTTVWTGAAGSKGSEGAAWPPPVYRDDAESNLGYDSFDGFLGGGVGSGTTWKRVYLDNSSPRTWQLADDGGYADEVEVQAARAWIEDVALPSGDPWLAVVALTAPHTRGAGGGYAEEDVTLDTYCARKDVMASPLQSYYTCLHNAPPPASDNCGQAQIYQALVECMDERINDFLVDVANIDIGTGEGVALTNTVVVFMGDNGTLEAAMETPYIDPTTHDVGKGQVYQSGVRVPFIMASAKKYTGGTAEVIVGGTGGLPAAGVSVTSLVQTWDLYATMIDAAAGSFGTDDATTDSISLYNCFTSNSATCANIGNTPRFHYAETFEVDETTSPHYIEGQAAVGVMVGSIEYTMIAYNDPSVNCMKTELYKLNGTPTDPNQTSQITGSSSCTTVRGKFQTVNAEWMPHTSGGTINWCTCSCSSTAC